jgi:Spy/CpxP family protein refolding chaperone
MKILDTKSVAALALGALTVLGAPTFAQTQSPKVHNQSGAKARGGRGGANALVNRLNLTKEQKQQIRPILKASREQTRTIRQDTTLSNEQKRQSLETVRQSTQQQIAKFLTADQLRQLETLQQQKRAEQRQNRSERRSQRSQSDNNAG